MATIERSGTQDETRRQDSLLFGAAVFFAVAVLIHNSDHARRGVDSINRDVFWIGTSAIALEVALVVLPFMRHRLAPLAATAGGFALAAGYVFTHFLPEHGFLSDSFVSAHNVSPLSWFAASLEVVAAATLGSVGLRVLRARGGLASATRPNPTQGEIKFALLHPVALAMIVGNAVILVISIFQL